MSRSQRPGPGPGSGPAGTGPPIAGHASASRAARSPLAGREKNRCGARLATPSHVRTRAAARAAQPRRCTAAAASPPPFAHHSPGRDGPGPSRPTMPGSSTRPPRRARASADERIEMPAQRIRRAGGPVVGWLLPAVPGLVSTRTSQSTGRHAGGRPTSPGRGGAMRGRFRHGPGDSPSPGRGGSIGQPTPAHTSLWGTFQSKNEASGPCRGDRRLAIRVHSGRPP
jgi:hypothetical protein